MNTYKRIIIIGNLLLLLVFINWSIASKESIVSGGKLVLLELAPVDPRSLMQGDYMQLRYKLTNELRTDEIPKRGYYVVTCNAQQVATTGSMQKEKTPRKKDEVVIKYYSNGWSINIGAESYFFQEGKAEKLTGAKYGGIRVDDNGNSVLQGLYDVNYKLIVP